MPGGQAKEVNVCPELRITYRRSSLSSKKVRDAHRELFYFRCSSTTRGPPLAAEDVGRYCSTIWRCQANSRGAASMEDEQTEE